MRAGGGLRGSLPAAQHAALKALSLVAYTYTEGPWRRLWIRFGVLARACNALHAPPSPLPPPPHFAGLAPLASASAGRLQLASHARARVWGTPHVAQWLAA